MHSAAYIFPCTDTTEQECLDSKTFGVKETQYFYVNGVTAGCPVFLYNFTRKELIGPFTARGTVQVNRDSAFFGGQYPVQIPVERTGPLRRIPRAQLEGIVPFNVKGTSEYPYQMITGDSVDNLLHLLSPETPAILVEPPESKEFRSKYPCTIRCMDGHIVRSHYERAVDDWLFSQRIPHGYERLLIGPDGSEYHCDFWIPTKDQGDMYIEVWGMVGDEKYDSYKAKKQEFYRKNGYPLIELTPEDRENLDDVMRRKVGVWGCMN